MSKRIDLHDAMKQIGISQDDLSEKLGVRPETLYRWIKGRAKMPAHLVNQVLSMIEETNGSTA